MYGNLCLPYGGMPIHASFKTVSSCEASSKSSSAPVGVALLSALCFLYFLEEVVLPILAPTNVRICRPPS